MTAFSKPKSSQPKRPLTLEVKNYIVETVQESIETFYDVLNHQQNNTGITFHSYINLEPILSFTVNLILREAIGPSKKSLALCNGLTGQTRYAVSGLSDGHTSATLITCPLQTTLHFGATSMLGTVNGRDMLSRLMFFPAPGSNDCFTNCNPHFFIWWDTRTSCGRFLSSTREHSFPSDEIGNCPCSIICCTQEILVSPKTIAKVKSATGVSYSIGPTLRETITIYPEPCLGTFLGSHAANLWSRAILSQKAAFFRKKFFRATNDLLYDNLMWQMSFQCAASGREKTLQQYMSHIRLFHSHTGLSVREIFLKMCAGTLEDSLVEKFLFKRLTEVNIDTIIQGVHAFNWFYRRFHNRKNVKFHENIFALVYILRKRLRNEKQGSDHLTWAQMKTLFKHILKFDWKPFQAKDILALAIISLWGALRISESCALSKLTSAFISTEDLLRLTFYDAKSAIGDKPQWKYVSSFPDHPDFCAHDAFFRLAKGKSYEPFVVDGKNKPITPERLSPIFKRFIDSLQARNILPASKHFSWHVFRASYLNIGFDEFNMPINYCSATASHRSVTSTEGYVARTLEKRRKLSAHKFAAQAAKQMTDSQESSV